ncbi:hypothetical protein [Streptococcus mutans]|uniref:hypothetical protein n=1 Tax=Streptococcus mutans TaxID=1309 RepID=UPI001BE8C006|nr:hypothetical protein [Streptococcus mutans]MBT3148391.1 hypothetical protein [Streptococcus mutans]
MKHTITRFQKNLYEWNFYTNDVEQEFKDFLKENKETRIDSKSRMFQNHMMMCFAYQYYPLLFQKIHSMGFKW